MSKFLVQAQETLPPEAAGRSSRFRFLGTFSIIPTFKQHPTRRNGLRGFFLKAQATLYGPRHYRRLPMLR